jgi:uncharacterized integral membrane protein
VFRKIVTALIVVPLAVIIIAFAVANRQMVTVSFDPTSSTNPVYAATVPLFVLIFFLLIFGVIIGGIAAWLRQSPWRRTARELDADVRALHDELAGIRHRFANEPHAAAPPPGALPRLPPSDS